MPRIGTTSSNFFRFGLVNRDNVIADLFTMPLDGWITNMAVHAGGYGETTYARLAIWKGGGSLSRESSTQTWNGGRNWRFADMGDLRFAKGTQFYAGFWRDRQRGAQWSSLDNGETHQAQSYTGHNDPPSHFAPYTSYATKLTCYVDFIANAPPARGSFTGEFPSGVIGDFTPAFEGTLPHISADRDYDHSTMIHFRIYDKTTRRFVYNRGLSTSQEERDTSRFYREPFKHEPGHSYYAEFRHRDTWGVYSPFSDQTHYIAGSGPDKPVISSPVGKVTSLKPDLGGSYDHPDGRPMSAVQVEVWNADFSVRLLASRKIAKTKNSGEKWGHTFADAFGSSATLSWGTSYTVRARTWDVNDVVGDWGPFSKLKTNSYPFVPGSLSPSGGRATAQTILRCSVSDPDGDPVTATAYLYNSAGALLTGFPKAMVTAPDGRTATLDVKASLVLGSAYTWRATASDGLLTSSMSTQAAFTYAEVPMVSLISPAPGVLVNEARQPSAEYPREEVSEYWSLPPEVSVTQDGDAAFGTSAWESTVITAATAQMSSPTFPVRPTKPFKLFAAFKSYVGDGTGYLALECFSSSGASLGVVVVYNSVPEGFWTRHGKTIIPSEFPTGTVRARVVCHPARLPSSETATNRVDAFDFGELEAGSVPAEDYWRGYFDGDTTGFGPPRLDEATGSPIPDYAWTGAPGDSSSTGPPVLTTPSNVVVRFTYASSSSRAKADDRVVIEHYDGAKWVERFRSDFGAAKTGGVARTSVEIPPSTFDSESRYRLKLWVRDTLGLEFEGDYVEFDVRYQGPPEMLVSQVAPDPQRAEITVSFAPSTLSPLEFGGIEIEVEQSSGERISHLITDPEATEFVYRYPESGYPHLFRLRQTQLVSDERIEGKWVEVEGSVDYFPVFFVKSVRDPNLAISFNVLAANRPSHKPVRNRKRYETWGNTKPKYAVGPLRTVEGSLRISLFDDAKFTLSADEKLRILERMEDDEDIVCILSHKPTRKRFCQVTDWGDHTTNDAEDYETEISWEEVTYFEDVRLRTEQ